jgi:hypothetical protein
MRSGCIQGLNVSRCELDDMAMRDLVEVVNHNPQPLQSLNMSCNPGRLPAHIIPLLMSSFSDLRDLDLRGVIQGSLDGPLLPYDSLAHLTRLEALDISNFKVSIPLLDCCRRMQD